MANDTIFTEEQEEAAIEAINEHCQAQLEYAETHKDAGDSYAHMPCEGDTVDMQNRLVKFLAEQEIPTGGLEPDELIDAALENFKMIRGTIYGMAHGYTESDFFVLDSYPVQEVEISLDGLDLSQDLIKAVARSCDATINDNGMAYLTTDAVWLAAIHKDDLKEAVADLVASHEPRP